MKGEKQLGEIIIRKVPKSLRQEFKVQCAREGKSMQEKGGNFMSDILIRFEIVKIVGQRESAENGISGLLYDAQTLFDYIKTGKSRETERQAA